MNDRHRLAIAALELANRVHRIGYEWAAPDPRLDGKAARPWDDDTRHAPPRRDATSRRPGRRVGPS